MAQESLNSRLVEEKTYQLFLDKNWGSLIDFGKEALQGNVDYFYLRMRIGIAYYEIQQYRLAEKHFRKALQFNSQDETTQEYYYYSLFFSGQYDEARKLANDFTPDLKKKIRLDHWGNLNVVFAEGGPKISSRSDYFNTALYFQAGLNHTLGNKLSLTHAINFYQQRVAIGDFSQYQYYLGINIPFKSGWMLTPVVHAIGRSTISTLTSPRVGNRPPVTTQTTVSSSSFISAISVSKRLSYADLTLASTFSNVEGFNQYIQQFSLTLYPFGTRGFAVGNIAYYHYESQFGGAMAWNPFVSLKPVSGLYLQANYYWNVNANLIERGGYIVNNSPDLTSSRWTGMADLALSNHFSIYGLFIFENKEYRQLTTQFNYTYSTIVLGLKFIP